VNPGLPRLVVLPNHQAVTKSATVLSSPRTKALVSELKDRYESRFVVFDLPPLLPTDDAIAFMAQIDCVLLVVTQGHSTESDVKESLRLLQPFHLLGTVLNKSDSGPKKYGKYY
jgi:Mrp family chromosome partitioning ATPase